MKLRYERLLAINIMATRKVHLHANYYLRKQREREREREME